MRFNNEQPYVNIAVDRVYLIVGSQNRITINILLIMQPYHDISSFFLPPLKMKQKAPWSAARQTALHVIIKKNWGAETLFDRCGEMRFLNSQVTALLRIDSSPWFWLVEFNSSSLSRNETCNTFKCFYSDVNNMIQSASIGPYLWNLL